MIVICRSQVFPKVIKYTDAHSYVLTVIFASLAVATPWIFHQFHLAGPTFLPMHFFVLIAGLLLGWRAGLTVGLLTPIISFATSGMPAIMILPQVIIELLFYGLAAGILRQKFNLRVIWSLIGAMIGGWIGGMPGAFIGGTTGVGAGNLVKSTVGGRAAKLFSDPVVYNAKSNYLPAFAGTVTQRDANQKPNQ